MIFNCDLSQLFLIPMTTVKCEKMYDEDNVSYVDDIEIKFEIKREWGEKFEREEEDRRGKDLAGLRRKRRRAAGCA